MKVICKTVGIMMITQTFISNAYSSIEIGDQDIKKREEIIKTNPFLNSVWNNFSDTEKLFYQCLEYKGYIFFDGKKMALLRTKDFQWSFSYLNQDIGPMKLTLIEITEPYILFKFKENIHKIWKLEKNKESNC